MELQNSAARQIPLADTHCHLDMEQFASDREAVIRRFFASDGELLINASFDLDSAAAARDLAEAHDNVYYIAGIHPHYAHPLSQTELARLRKLLRHPKCVGLGEVGLDYYRDLAPREIQQQMFAALLEMAVMEKRRVIIHSRDAASDVLAAVRPFMTALPGGILHCFDGDPGMAEYFQQHGFYVSLAGNITFPKAESLREAVRRYVSLDRLVLETDCPYLAPQRVRGKRNEPVYVREVVMAVAELFAAAVEEIAAITVRNAWNYIAGAAGGR